MTARITAADPEGILMSGYRLLGRVLTQVSLVVAIAAAVGPGTLAAQQATPSTSTPGAAWAEDLPALSRLVDFARSESDLRVAVNRYLLDKAAIERRYEVPSSPVRHARLRTFYQGWLRRLAESNFDGLNAEGRIDYVLLRNRVEYDFEALTLAEARWNQIAPLLPFADRLRVLQEDRFDRKRVDPRAAANTLNDVARQVKDLTEALAKEGRQAPGGVTRAGVTPVIASRAAGHLDALRTVLTDWNAFYDGYDPLFSWWAREPYGRLDKALQAYGDALRLHLAGIRPGEKAPIIGDPVLAEGLRADLAYEMIPYTPDELIAIGMKEFDWIENEFRIVARRMGFGDDWKAALEHTKNLAPPPGEKPWAIFDIAEYSETFVAGLQAITMPPLAREVWRLAMQTPERQLVNPFFTGGEVTRVSYPTDSMTHDDKLMSMRGNTPHFNFATVHHELIPGHHMQAFLTDRFNPHRAALQRTPFWREGWSLYWELQLWDRNFPRNDPDRIGMLFWRLHRAARIVFSLNYHLGKWTPQQAVDFLVDRVGHERANAEGEVRRTTIDAPLYQVAYMIGGLQLRALYKELVDGGTMTATQFHDGVLEGGYMPIELVRARLMKQPVTRDQKMSWRFYGDPAVR
jgi:uncharacterized protein (DUF885 family)